MSLDVSTALHADALATLTRWQAPDAAQDALRQRYVAHLEAHADGMQRSCHPDHLTASTLLLSHDGEQVLLTLHAKAQQWFQLGGHCEDADRTLAGAALREATEESGIKGIAIEDVPLRLDEHAVPFCGSVPGVHHLDVWFVGHAPEGAETAISEESLDLRWWPLSDLPGAHAWDEARRLLERRRPQST